MRPTLRLVIYLPILAITAAILLIPLTLVVNWAFAAIGYLASDITTPSSLAGAWVLLILDFGFTLSVVLALLFNLRIFDRRSFVSLGFQRQPGWASDVMFGLALGALLIAIVVAVEWAAGWLRVETWLGGTQGVLGLVGPLVYALILFSLSGFTEEVTMRGYLLQNLKEESGTPVAVVVSSAIFSLLHLGNPSVSALAIFNIAIAGLLFAVGYLATGGLWLPIALHFSWNFFEGPVFGFPVSGTTGPSPVLQVIVEGPPVLTGGSFGPEAGLVGLIAMAVGIAFVILRAHRTPSPMALVTFSSRQIS